MKRKKKNGELKNYKELILTHPLKEISRVLFELKDEYGEEEWSNIPERTRVNYIHNRISS